jgi:hypothetical protein
MKLSFLLCIVVFFSLTPREHDHCELKGAVYIEKTAAFADYKVYVEPTEDFADMMVYKEEVVTFADEAGVWYFTEVREEASFSIHLEDNPDFADFSIFYTKFRADAGCP